MGIPAGWNIVRDDAKEKDVLRADVTGSRSPIRRRARGTRATRHLDVLDVYSHAPRFARPGEHTPRLSHARTQLPPAPPVPELRDRDVDRDVDRDELQPRPLSSDRGHPARERMLPALTPGFAPAARPSQRYEEARLAAERARSLSSPYEQPLLYSTSYTTRRPSYHSRQPDGVLPSQRSPPRLRPGSASRQHMPLDDWLEQPERLVVVENDESTIPTDTLSHVPHPPLRRVGHRRIADGPLPASSLRESWSPVPTVDGLGDRERSNSVSSTSSNSLPWHSIVMPDPVPPTAESSFASSAASASFAASSTRASSSNSNSAASEHTHVTVPSRRPSPGLARRRGDDFREAFACESSDDGDSTASDTEDEATANPLSRRRIRPSYFADEPPSPRRHGRSVQDQSSDLRRYVREYVRSHSSADHGTIYQLDGPRDVDRFRPLDGPAREEREPEADSFATVADSFTTVDDGAQSTSPASPRDQELRDARSLLERLTRRGDIGDDFWASVGLTRSFADGVERVQERGRF